MDMGTVGWIALGWFAMALVLSLALGGFLRKVSETPGEEDIAVAVSRQKVMRFMRVHGQKSGKASSDMSAPRVRETGKRSTG